MTENIQESKLRLTKDYNKTLEQVKEMTSKTASVYVPMLCEALRIGNPKISNRDIRVQVKQDCYDIWSYGTVQKYWPDWIKDPTKVLSAKEAIMRRQQVQRINKTFQGIPKKEPIDFQEPYNDSFYHTIYDDRETKHLFINPLEPPSLEQRTEPATPQNIIEWCEGLQRIITEYFPRTLYPEPRKNAIAIVDRWTSEQKRDVYEVMGQIKKHFDALFNVLEQSLK